ncbi:MAG: amino acid ABC transporter permease [Ruminococcaceae bacterium]|jgi:polar amino acid transport system permease protein|nr:amino acid ABC transporter permease [Oscillospiraceae bacterium]
MLKKAISILLVTALLASLFFYAVVKLDHHWQWQVLSEYSYKFSFGFMVTLLISFFSLLGSLLLGLFAALGRRSKVLFFRYLASVYVEVIRSTPLLVQILLFFYIIGTAYRLTNRYAMGVLILSLFAGAYVAEIIRGGLESIPSAQLETARSLCFTKVQTYRYIVIPQLSRIVLPPLTGQFASLVKDSSLLSFIAVNEFTKMVMEADALNFATFENYMLLAVGYMLITLPISWLTKRLERKMYYAN